MNAGDEGLEPQVSARGIEPRESSHHERHVAQQEADICPERHQRYDSMAATAASVVRELAQRSSSGSDQKRCLACPRRIQAACFLCMETRQLLHMQECDTLSCYIQRSFLLHCATLIRKARPTCDCAWCWYQAGVAQHGVRTDLYVQGQMLLCRCAMGNLTAKGSCAHAAGLGFCTDNRLGAGEAFSPLRVLAHAQSHLDIA